VSKLIKCDPLYAGQWEEIADKIKEVGVEEAIRQLPYSRERVLFVAHKAFEHPLPESCLLKEPVKDVKVVEVVEMCEDDHTIFMTLFFKDEQDRLRLVSFYSDYGPGMVRYSECCEEAKKDLIDAVNTAYEIAREDEEEES